MEEQPPRQDVPNTNTQAEAPAPAQPAVDNPVTMAAQPRPPKKRKHLLLVLVALAVIAGAAAVYVLGFHNKDNAAPGADQSSRSTKPSETTMKFYVTEAPNKVVTYDLATGTKETTALNLEGGRQLAGSMAGVNQGVQMARGGEQIFYASNQLDESSEHMEPVVERTFISVFANNAETKLVELDASAERALVDWVVAPDGGTIYYIATTPNKGGEELHMVTVSDKTDTRIDVGGAQLGGTNPLFITPDGTLLAYSGTEDNRLIEHKVANGQHSTTDLGAPCDCSLEYPQAISPDGAKLLLEELDQEDETSTQFRYYVYDRSTRELTRLSEPEANVQWRSSLWSADGTQLAHDTSGYGANNETHKQRIAMLRAVATDEKPQTIYESANGGESLAVLAWAADGSYIAFADERKIMFYDVAQAKMSPRTLANELVMNSDVSYGWY